jgi:hypothetical protein
MPRVDTTNDIAIVEFKPAAERNQVTSTQIWRVIGSRSIPRQALPHASSPSRFLASASPESAVSFRQSRGQLSRAAAPLQQSQWRTPRLPDVAGMTVDVVAASEPRLRHRDK